MMHTHLLASENPYAQVVRDLETDGLLTPAEAHDLLTSPFLPEES